MVQPATGKYTLGLLSVPKSSHSTSSKVLVPALGKYTLDLLSIPKSSPNRHSVQQKLSPSTGTYIVKSIGKDTLGLLNAPKLLTLYCLAAFTKTNIAGSHYWQPAALDGAIIDLANTIAGSWVDLDTHPSSLLSSTSQTITMSLPSDTYLTLPKRASPHHASATLGCQTMGTSTPFNYPQFVDLPAYN